MENPISTVHESSANERNQETIQEVTLDQNNSNELILPAKQDPLKPTPDYSKDNVSAELMTQATTSDTASSDTHRSENDKDNKSEITETKPSNEHTPSSEITHQTDKPQELFEMEEVENSVIAQAIKDRNPQMMVFTRSLSGTKKSKMHSLSDAELSATPDFFGGQSGTISPNTEEEKSTTDNMSSDFDTNKSDDKKSPSKDRQHSQSKMSVVDFNKIQSLGKGSYAEVTLVKRITTGKLYALKAIDKAFMEKEKKQYQVFVEKEVLKKLDHPNIIKLHGCFPENNKLYFVLEYIAGGEFAEYLTVNRKLPFEQTQFFAAEIVSVLEYIHNAGIGHRDLKPENILLTPEGHIKVIDFGTARFLNSDARTSDLFQPKNSDPNPEQVLDKKSHRSTFVGTAQYVSPEMLEDSECAAPADIWALACMIYQMEVGKYPFLEGNEYLTFQKIKNVDVKYPENMNPDVKDILQKMFVRKPEQRLGAGPKGSENDYEALKSHPLFKGIDFTRLHEQKPPVNEVVSPHKKKKGSFREENTAASEPVKKESTAGAGVGGGSNCPPIIDRNITITLSGLVEKKCGWVFYYKPRQLILNSKPRLMYYDPETNQLKGEIPLHPETKADLESKTKFVVTTPQRKYIFKQVEHTAEKWVKAINDAVKKLYNK
jgi:3-phosphoinositide dependent protein kinase-1